MPGTDFSQVRVFGTADVSATVPQPRLALGPADDRFEQEADRVAERLLMTPHPVDARTSPPPPVTPISGPGLVQRETAGEGDGQGGLISAETSQAIENARGGGQPLPAPLRTRMEQALGADFGAVRVHTDRQAGALNDRLRAQAFTTGDDVFVRQDAHAPRQPGSQILLAHELAHVLQQRGTDRPHQPSLVQRGPGDWFKKLKQKVLGAGDRAAARGRARVRDIRGEAPDIEEIGLLDADLVESHPEIGQGAARFVEKQSAKASALSMGTKATTQALKLGLEQTGEETGIPQLVGQTVSGARHLKKAANLREAGQKLKHIDFEKMPLLSPEAEMDPDVLAQTGATTGRALLHAAKRHAVAGGIDIAQGLGQGTAQVATSLTTALPGAGKLAGAVPKLAGKGARVIADRALKAGTQKHAERVFDLVSSEDPRVRDASILQMAQGISRDPEKQELYGTTLYHAGENQQQDLLQDMLAGKTGKIEDLARAHKAMGR